MYKTSCCTRDGMQVWLLQDAESGTKAEIVPQRGALLTSLCAKGIEYIYCDRENLCSDERPRCGMPVLFPCCSRNTDNVVRLEGKTYPMPIHGFAHTSPWQVVDHGANETEAWLELELLNSEQSDEMYPYRFELRLLFLLKGNELTVKHTCSNRDHRPMPFDFGYHPYFAMSDLDNVEFGIPGQAEPLRLEGGKPETGHFIRQPVTGVEYRDRGRGTSVILNYSDNFDGLVFWSGPAKRFVCVEPWQGGPDGLNKGASITLQPGQSSAGVITITLGRCLE